MAVWTRVASLADCPPGKLKGVMAGMQPIVLANVDGDICALEDQCSHEAYPLSDGELDGSTLVCMYHGARFDACTGRNKGLPAIRPVKAYPVEVRDGEIYVEV
ncbi:MAG TPA: non-heme iron oxygenase ferredoxin subunit [Longimicrobiales bacterium]|nr:non-heme iron oxygenase ferredoxin subunit [Longimicrobiales bacterium]